MDDHYVYLTEAIGLASQAMKKGGGPFGAVVVSNGIVIGRGMNETAQRNDPTAHAEVMAIRDACTTISRDMLADCVLYSSCEPCPMCLAAAYWAGISQIYFSATHTDAGEFGFADAAIEDEIRKASSARRLPSGCHLQKNGRAIFEEWREYNKSRPH